MCGLLLCLSGKESACKAGATGYTDSIPGSGRSPGGGHGKPLQYYWLENIMDKGAWQATVHRVAKTGARPKQLSTHACIYMYKAYIVFKFFFISWFLHITRKFSGPRETVWDWLVIKDSKNLSQSSPLTFKLTDPEP